MVKIYIFIFNINIIQMVMLIWIGLYRSSQLIQPSHPNQSNPLNPNPDKP